MSGRWGGLVGTLLGGLLLATTAAGQSFGTVGWEKFFTLDWEAAEHRGRPVVRGQVVNEYGASATNIQLLVEGIDAAGAVVDTTLAYVASEVPPGGRGYFETLAPRSAGTYRIRVLYYERLEAGGDHQ